MSTELDGDVPIDVAYNVKATVPDAVFDREIRRYRTASDAAVASLPGVTGIPYDEHSGEVLDVWGTGDGLRPVLIAVHGGYWRLLSRKDTAFMARTMADEGIATVAVDYSLAPRVTLEEIIRQVRAAVAWVHHHGARHGLDRERIFVTGSSAGGHLTGAVMVGGWQQALGLPADVIKGAMPISGLFDLRPLVHSFANDWLSLDETRAADLSPLLAPAGTAPAIVAVAEHDGIGFRAQSWWFHRAWGQHAVSRLMVVPERNHYDAFTDLADPDAPLTRVLVDMIHDPGTVSVLRSSA